MARKSKPKDFILLLRGGKSPEDMSPEKWRAHGQKYYAWIRQMRKQGQYKDGRPLGDKAKLLSGRKGKVVKSKPHGAPKADIGGFFFIRARNLAQAVKIARGCPIFD